MGRLVIFDTSNYEDFPIGGQLTSVRGFLRFLAVVHPEAAQKVLLVGVTKSPDKVGEEGSVSLEGVSFRVRYVCAAETDLAHTQHSLRAAFAKGILKYGSRLALTGRDLLYIQTPEAAGPAKLLAPRAKFVVFSHGSYANMERGFRFYQKSFVKKAFLSYLRWVLRHASCIFVLDERSRKDYLPYNKNLILVKNSIVLPENYDAFAPAAHPFQGRLLFVGRLSKDKGVDGICEAARLLAGEGITLTIVGEGEEGEHLRRYAGEGIRFVGAVPPDEVPGYLENADILVMNSAFEGVPMTILEALSHGLPIISTDVGGIGATVSFGQDAEKTDGTPVSIAAAVRKIRADYGAYASKAHAHAKDYDYRAANVPVWEGLRTFWKD
ncbi:MAG: glycosyltransferase family 4 protein [Lachnospiraceae bacterium]